MLGANARQRGIRKAGVSACAVLAALLICAPAASSALGDTIVLTDGTIIEGTIVRESTRYVRVKVQGLDKSIRRSQIDKIIREDVSESALAKISAIRNFQDLPPLAQKLKNAEALYRLGRFEEIPPLVEPLIGQGTKVDDMRIRWLLIENFERQGKWTEAEELLKKTLEDGREPDKIRAQAHLDIFEENPGHTLRKIGGKRTRKFLTWDMYLKGKRRNALQDPEMMNAALREVVDQLLRHEKISVAAFIEILDEREMVEMLDDVIKEDRHAGAIIRDLPYLQERRKVENAIYKANAIMPGVARGFALDLVRQEVLFLDKVVLNTLGPLNAAYPRGEQMTTDEFGKLTPEGREQWREQCDNFLEASRPIVEIIRYMLERCSLYPSELQNIIEMWTDVLERIEQMQQNTQRNRDKVRV